MITVSKGKKEDQTVSVPNLRYYTESEASQELQRFGLSLGSVLTEYSDSVEKRTCHSSEDQFWKQG